MGVLVGLAAVSLLAWFVWGVLVDDLYKGDEGYRDDLWSIDAKPDRPSKPDQ